jgi:hypothetical protein
MTRDDIQQMSEKQLRESVLVPLFEAMGYHGVHVYHGGSLELGKDIIMWKEEGVAERLNYAVVAKAEAINGKVSGKGSFSEVLTQVNQCFGTRYFDPKSLKDIEVDRCIVVTSKTFPKEAQNAIRGQLRNSHLDKVTQFIDGDELWRYFERYLGARTVLAKLSGIRETLEAVDPFYRVAVDTRGNVNTLHLEPKSPEALLHPIKMGAKFHFPTSPQGVEARAAFEQHVRTGSTVTLHEDIIKEFHWPEILKPFLGDDAKVKKLVLGPRKIAARLLVTLEARNDNGESAILRNLDLQNELAGQDEFTFSNDQQPVPWKCRIVMNRHTGAGTFCFHVQYAGSNVREELEGARFVSTMASGATLILTDEKTGLEMARVKMAPSEGAPPRSWIQLLELLLFIQIKTQTVLRIPDDRTIRAETAELIEMVADIIQTGSITFHADTLDLELPLDGAKALLSMTGAKLAFAYPPQKETLLGSTIELGQVHVQYTFSKEECNVDEIAAAVAAGTDPIKVHVVCRPDTMITATYPKWKSQPPQSADQPIAHPATNDPDKKEQS